jgi:hypothetical protein
MLGRGLCLRIVYFCILYTNYFRGDFIASATFLQNRERTSSSLLMTYIVGSFVHNIPFRSGLPSWVDTLQASGKPRPSLDFQRRHGERTKFIQGLCAAVLISQCQASVACTPMLHRARDRRRCTDMFDNQNLVVYRRRVPQRCNDGFVHSIHARRDDAELMMKH